MLQRAKTICILHHGALPTMWKHFGEGPCKGVFLTLLFNPTWLFSQQSFKENCLTKLCVKNNNPATDSHHQPRSWVMFPSTGSQPCSCTSECLLCSKTPTLTQEGVVISQLLLAKLAVLGVVKTVKCSGQEQIQDQGWEGL